MSAEHLARPLSELYRALERYGFTVLDVFDSPPARYGFARVEYRDPRGGEHTVRVGNRTSSSTSANTASFTRPVVRSESPSDFVAAHAARIAAGTDGPVLSTVSTRNAFYRDLSALVERAVPDGARDEDGVLTRSYRDEVTAAGLNPYWGVRLAALVSLSEGAVDEVRNRIGIHPAREVLVLLADGLPLEWAARRVSAPRGERA